MSPSDAAARLWLWKRGVVGTTMEAGTAEVAESEFRTQPVATAVSATGGVDTTPTCTRADAHFSRAHITVHNSFIDPYFSNVGTPHWLKVTGICVAHFFLCTHFLTRCYVLVEWSSWSLPSCYFLTYLFSVKTLSVIDLVGET